MKDPDALFDYREKSSEWIRKIQTHNTAILLLNGSIPVYEKIVKSAKAELKRRGEPE